MYDALRMEITNTSASPATTGWNDYAYITGANTQSGPVDSVGLTASQTFAPQAPSLTWNNTGSPGDGVTWDSGTVNWNNGTSPALYADGDNVTLNDTNNGNYALTLNSTIAPASLLVNNSNGNYSISGSGSITGTTGLLKVGTGTLTLSTVNTYTGGTIVNGGALVVGANGALPNGNVSVSASGELMLALNTGVTNVQSLAIATGGIVDLTNNSLMINYGSAMDDPVTTIQADLTAAYAAHYAEPGLSITSSTAAAHPTAFVLGYFDNTATDQFQIMFTIPGDATLDGHTNFNDLLVIAQHFGQTTTPGLGWTEGDVNYDGVVNFNDLLIVAQNFGDTLSAAEASQLPASFVAQFNLALTELHTNSVPEPSGVAMGFIAAGGLLRRRRRRVVKCQSVCAGSDV
jgi:autotransporter-associated beta strand protein